MQRAHETGRADEALNLVDACVEGEALAETDTTIVDWTQARDRLQHMLEQHDAADRAASGFV